MTKETITVEQCEWKLSVDCEGDPIGDDYESDCGTGFYPDDDYSVPGEGDFLYCFKCGKKVKLIEVNNGDE